MRFVLVHGGFHGAWCWEKLIPELVARGHDAIAVDCPGHGERAGEEATLAGYRDAVVAAIEPGDIIVGHSMGGFTTTVAVDAAIERVSHVVYLAAGLPIEGEPMTTAGAGRTSQRTSTVNLVDDGRKMEMVSKEAATDFFFHDCAPELVDWAWDRLTPQPMKPMTEPISVPRFWNASPPRSLILCRQDRASNAGEAGNIRTAQRLGVEPLWLDTSHSPFLSQPAACAEAILQSLQQPGLGPIQSG